MSEGVELTAGGRTVRVKGTELAGLLTKTQESAEEQEEPPEDPRTEKVVGISRKLAATEIMLLSQAGLSTTELLDYWMVEYGGYTAKQWAGARGTNQNNVQKHVREATAKIHGPENE